MSEQFITAFNSNVFFNIDRIVDYTELSALIVLYFCNNVNTKYPTTNYAFALKYAVVAISLFSFIATSMSPPYPLPPEGDVAINKTYKIKIRKEIIRAIR
ncbi:MAG: hypothetical protein ACI9VN_002938 [Patescibacteria group bacterium]|jgi:hypothetical protein